MKIIRTLSGLLILLSLVLPQTSCVQHLESGNLTEIKYAFSGSQSWWQVTVTVIIYLLPLLACFSNRFHFAGLIVGISSASLILYYASYAGYIFSSSVLSGWYTVTIGAFSYFLASFFQLCRWLVPSKALKPTGPPPLSPGGPVA